MATSLRDRAANRARLYRAAMAEKQSAGDFKGGVDEARRWLWEELAKVRRQRPHHADAIDAEVAAKLAAIAEQIPFYKPSGGGPRHVSS